MFNKSNKKATVSMSYQGEGGGGSSKSIPLKDGELLEYLKEEHKRHGELAITHITNDNEIHLSTARTQEYQDIEVRAGEIGNLVRNYIRSRAIEMDAYAVFAKGKLKGVFGQSYNAGFKKSQLIREGFTLDEIDIIPIKTESFDDIQ